jgi:PIN domain nuclease of toxin-antitoxin system
MIMDILLDTHVFLWWDQDAPNLAAKAREMIANPDNRVFVSAGSVWEIAIKRRAGKLAFTGSAVEAIRRNGFVELAMTGFEAELAGGLDWDHTDPFDRLIVAQAQHRDLTVFTVDTAMLTLSAVALVRAG